MSKSANVSSFKQLTIAQQEALAKLKSFIDSNDRCLDARTCGEPNRLCLAPALKDTASHNGDAVRQSVAGVPPVVGTVEPFRRSHRFFRLNGYAGSGKSFLICHLIEWLQSRDFAFVAAAPTNKAAKNLQQVAISTGIIIDVKTVAQLLGQQPEINEETGLEEFTVNNDVHLDDYQVIIIDEFSMINHTNFDLIVDAISLRGCLKSQNKCDRAGVKGKTLATFNLSIA